MNDFGKREIYIDLIKEKQSTITISIYLASLLLIVFIGFFMVDEARFLLGMIFCAGLTGLMGIWISFFNSQKNYQSIPYLTLDENGFTLNQNGLINFIYWQDIVMIDIKIKNTTNGHETYYAIETANQEYILSQGKLSANFEETWILLKRYTEHYGTAKFIY